MTGETKIAKNLADEILSLKDERSEIVAVPMWNDIKILCKNLSGADRAKLAGLVTFDTKGTMINRSTSADVVILGAYNPDTGQRVFTPEMRTALLEKNSAALEFLAEKINELSGITSRSAEAAEKN